jgi:pimeloyl-ACP methyl ester carboxylesterase
MIDQSAGGSQSGPRPGVERGTGLPGGMRADEMDSGARVDVDGGTGVSGLARADEAGSGARTDADAPTESGDPAEAVPVQADLGEGAGAPPSRPRRPWWRRWARRLGLTALALAVAATLFSLVFNAATAGRAQAPAGLTYVRTGDLMTRYRVWGTGGSPVVLVHGAAESADTWEPVAGLLARDHRVYALDLNGAGYTSRRAPYNLDHQTRQLLAFLDALNLRRPLLVGHSSGAASVAEATLRAPDRAGGLMFLDGDALSTGAGPPPAFRYLVAPPYRTTILRLVVRSDWLIRTIYSAQCGPSCPRLDAAGLDRCPRPDREPAHAAPVGRRAQGGGVRSPGRRVRQGLRGPDRAPDRRPRPDADPRCPASDPDLRALPGRAGRRGPRRPPRPLTTPPEPHGHGGPIECRRCGRTRDG